MSGARTSRGGQAPFKPGRLSGDVAVLWDVTIGDAEIVLAALLDSARLTAFHPATCERIMDVYDALRIEVPDLDPNTGRRTGTVAGVAGPVVDDGATHESTWDATVVHKGDARVCARCRLAAWELPGDGGW